MQRVFLFRHLSDVNKDSALDIEEFCIAMHLVVAVKHDVELPPVLPTMLAPKPSAQAAQGFTTSFPTSSNDQPEEERPQSPKGRTTQPDEQVVNSRHFMEGAHGGGGGQSGLTILLINIGYIQHHPMSHSRST